ncbi:cation-chloride cotransporter 1-like [Papaver somniferum]|uniref:cation-chloride cotransporter 1-like n=1 Tax=Papaver somniferum TaxID=3469 RepID=UPI000E703688|nr:cation-chloride cotransporter 1-like [Papaver somniferum]
MTGEQLAAPSCPRDGEDVSITRGRPKPNDLKMWTMMGVFVPCLQNILGIIYYIRVSWIFGMACIWEPLLLVSLCGLCTFLTSISFSAVATDGAMKGGGPYYLIGRALGPEVGVSIGLCFFLGNAVAGSMYVLGAVETFLDAVPAAGIFKGDVFSAPLVGREADFLIHGIAKPLHEGDVIGSDSLVEDNDLTAAPCLDLDLLDKLQAVCQ